MGRVIKNSAGVDLKIQKGKILLLGSMFQLCTNMVEKEGDCHGPR